MCSSLWLLAWAWGWALANTVTSPLCVRSNAKCANDDSCLMTYIPGNSSVCSSVPYQSTITQVEQLTFGDIRLETYLYIDKILHQTAFNVTFENITWTRMQFRISLNGNPGKNTCREFIRDKNSTVMSIYYDCLWSDERYEGKPFILEYEASLEQYVEAVQMSFIVPFAPGIDANLPKDKLQLLVYVESIPSHLGSTSFILHWKSLPDNLEAERYQVLSLSGENDHEGLIIGQVLECGSSICSFTTQRWFGSVQFAVRPVFKGGKLGATSKSPLFVLGADSVRPMLYGLVSCSLLLPVVVYLVFLLRNSLVRQSVRRTSPTLLLVHTPSTTPHLHVVEALARYLNSHSNVCALMDELDIPLSIAKDPFSWCNEAMLCADIVVVVASPHRALRSSSALYRTDRLLLRLMRERMGTRSKTRFCVLMPSYTTPADIPSEAAGLRKYRLPEDLGQLMRLIRFDWSPLDSTRLDDLTACTKTAAMDLQHNRAEYLAQIEEKVDELPRTKQDKAKSVRSFPSWSPFEGKRERIVLAQDSLHAQLDTLNLLGDPPAPADDRPPKPHGLFDLDQLHL